MTHDYGIFYCMGMPDEYRDAIREILRECDDEFVPPLSQRSSPWQTTFTADRGVPMTDGIASYMQNMEKESFLVMTEESSDVPLAFLAYMPGHVHPEETDDETVDYVSTICTRHAHRGHGVAKRLYEALERFACHDVIVVRTWSTNLAHVHVLESMGYAEHRRIADDRGLGIDTIYFRKRREDGKLVLHRVDGQDGLPSQFLP